MNSKHLKRAISGPLAFATAGGTLKQKNSQQDLQGKDATVLDLNFQFPRPCEQTSQDLLNSSHFISSARELSRKKNAIRKNDGLKKTFVKLVHAILRGESERDLIKKIEDAKGLQTLLDLQLRIKDKASQESGDADSDVQIEISFSLFHLAVVESKPQTLLTMLNYIKSNHGGVEEMINSKVDVYAAEASIDSLRHQDVFMHGQNVIHLATEYSQECLEFLIFGPLGDIPKNHIEEKDYFQNTPLHLAASNVTSDCASKILDCSESAKSVLTAKDASGNTPVHVVCKKGTEETLFLFLNAAANDPESRMILNTTNKKDKTPIFYARTPKMVLILSMQPEVDCFAMRSEKKETVLEALLKNNSECAKTLLSSGISTNNKAVNDKDLLFIYDLKMLAKADTSADKEQDIKEKWNETEVLSNFLKFGQKSLLSHPLTETYLHLKWLTMRNFFYVNIFLYSFYLVFLTILTVWTSHLKYHDGKSFDATEGFAFFLCQKNFAWLWYIIYIVSFFSVTAITLRELIQMKNEKTKYFKSSENRIELSALISTWVYLIMTPWVMEFEQLFGAIAMFFAWLEMTLMLGRIPSIGMYTYMSTQVIRQLFMFFMVYVTSLFAFAITLHLLLVRDYKTENGVFDNLWTSCLKVLMLMIGEYDFMDTFTWDKIQEAQVITGPGWVKMVFPIFVQTVFILVLFLVSIIIANLITGLTVNNIRELYTKAGVYKLGKTVKQITSSEEFVSGRLMRFAKKCLPGFWKTILFARLHNPNDLHVCVEPNAIHTHDENIVNLVESENYEVYTYDGQQKTKSLKLDMHLPSWIIIYTFEHLKEKEKIQKELNESLRANIKVVQRDYTSVYEEVGARNPGRKHSEMQKSTPTLATQSLFRERSSERYEEDVFSSHDQFPIIDGATNEEVDLDLYSINAFVDNISNKQLTQFQKEKVVRNFSKLESKFSRLRSSWEIKSNEKKVMNNVSHL